jgi:zinc transporter ZupT
MAKKSLSRKRTLITGGFIMLLSPILPVIAYFLLSVFCSGGYQCPLVDGLFGGLILLLFIGALGFVIGLMVLINGFYRK